MGWAPIRKLQSLKPNGIANIIKRLTVAVGSVGIALGAGPS